MKSLRYLALLEGISLLLLVLVAMPLKYLYERPEAVEIVGMAHGILFIGYSLLLLLIGLRRKCSWATLAICFIAAFIPGGTFYADHRYFKPALSGSR